MEIQKLVSGFIVQIRHINILVIFAIFYFAIGAESTVVCPKALQSIPNVCDRFKCANNITAWDCPLDTFFEKNLTLCGCCPGCARYIGLPEKTPKKIPAPPKCVNARNMNTPFDWTPQCEGPKCPIQMNNCMPGLECDEQTGFCSLSTTPLGRDTHECRYKKSLHRLGLFHWDPECDEDGSYAPKQCKGDFVTGICFCVDRGGQRIFGHEFRVNAKNQTCECSRRVSNLRSAGNIATFHCSSNGNYEPVQCDTDSGVCFCVEEKTGLLNGAVVPEAQWKRLPCLTPNVTNFMRDGRYLRKCESVYAANLEIINEGVVHGHDIKLGSVNCDFDGSYAPVQNLGTKKQCVYKNGTRIDDFMIGSERASMDCNCARDQFLYRITGRPFSFECALQVGNYKNSFDFGSYASCIDRDGIPYGDMVPSKYHCCLENTCIPSTRQRCYDPITNKQGYRGCCHWPFGGTCAS